MAKLSPATILFAPNAVPTGWHACMIDDNPYDNGYCSSDGLYRIRVMGPMGRWYPETSRPRSRHSTRRDWRPMRLGVSRQHVSRYDTPQAAIIAVTTFRRQQGI